MSSRAVFLGDNVSGSVSTFLIYDNVDLDTKYLDSTALESVKAILTQFRHTYMFISVLCSEIPAVKSFTLQIKNAFGRTRM